MTVRQSKSFGAQVPKKAHLLQRTGGIAAEVQDLRDDVETGFQNAEERLQYPVIDWSDGGGAVVGGGDLTLKGRYLLQSQTFDQLVTGSGNSQVTYKMLKPGDSGFSVEHVQGAGALSAAIVGTKLTVTIASGGSTATAVAGAVNAACVGIILATAGGTGAENIAVLAETNLTGGAGDYSGNKVLVSGVEALPKHVDGSWANGTVVVTVPDLTSETDARNVVDLLQVELFSNGIVTSALTSIDNAAIEAVLDRVGTPELDWIDGGAPAAAGGDIILYGRNLLQSQTFDAAHVTEGSGDLLLALLKPGDSGYTYEVVAGAGALAIAISGTKLTITLASGGSTVNAVATAINADGADTEGIIRANEDASDTLTAAVSETAFTGGVGTYAGNEVRVSGVACLPANETGATTTAKWTDTKVTVTVPALTGESPARAAGDIAQISLKSDTKYAQPLAAALA
ncbi:MAG: hypothetical protein ACFFFC_00200 [Candidatus Thorarchaeota archaeon]